VGCNRLLVLESLRDGDLRDGDRRDKDLRDGDRRDEDLRRDGDRLDRRDGDKDLRDKDRRDGDSRDNARKPMGTDLRLLNNGLLNVTILGNVWVDLATDLTLDITFDLDNLRTPDLLLDTLLTLDLDLTLLDLDLDLTLDELVVAHSFCKSLKIFPVGEMIRPVLGFKVGSSRQLSHIRLGRERTAKFACAISLIVCINSFIDVLFFAILFFHKIIFLHFCIFLLYFKYSSANLILAACIGDNFIDCRLLGNNVF
jgi:hypothetical protein